MARLIDQLHLPRALNAAVFVLFRLMRCASRARPASLSLFPSFPAQLNDNFKQHYNESSEPVAWWSVTVLGAFLYLAFYFWDRVIDYEHSTKTLLVRIAIVISTVTPTLLLPRHIRARYLQELYSIIVAVGGIGVVIIISLLQNGLKDGLAGVVLVLMFNFGFLRLLFVPSLLSGLAICVSYNMAAIIGHLELLVTIANDFFLVAALIAGASVTYLLERLFRSQFLSERELVQEREALARRSQNDARYLAWLRQLAQFLRHEVRQPVAQINSSVEVAKLGREHDDHLMSVLASAALATQQVWNLIERASRATDYEAFVRQCHPQLTDLRHLLAEQLEAFRQTTGTDFELQSPTPICTYIDPTLIKAAVGNLLDNAASFAKEGSTVEVALTVDAAHATIRVSNQGPQIVGDTEVLFGPFVSTRSGPSSEHHGLGLYLVRLIAEQHGGTASIANLEDSTGVQASIVLPLRATPSP